MSKIATEFKEFLMRGNVIDMAVGIVIGGAFTGIVKSLVADVIMPPIGLLLGGVDFSNLFWVLKDGKIPAPYETLKLAQDAGAVTVNLGLFINTLISFVLVGAAVFLLVKTVNSMHKKEDEPEEVTEKDCPFCCSSVPIKASRCSHCTSQLDT